MKILAISDIHWPNTRISALFYKTLRKRKYDLIIIAGDLISLGDRRSLEKLVKILRKFFKSPIVATAGNHEHWLSRKELKKGLTSLEKLEKISKFLEENNIHLLNTKGRFKLDDLYIVGTTGWYDYSYAENLGFTRKDFENCNPWGCTLQELWNCERGLECNCKDWLRDCLYVRLNMSNEEYLMFNLKILEKQLIQARDPTIVVLHHTPRGDLIKYSGNRYEDFYTAYHGSWRLDKLIRKYRNRVRLVIYGHLHENSRETLLEVNRIIYLNPYSFHPKIRSVGEIKISDNLIVEVIY